MADRATTVVKSGFRKAVSAFFEYDTPKIVHIKSKKVGVINRVIQAVILAYIIGYAIVYEKGYQEFGEVESVALTKLKGVTYTELQEDIPGISNRTWDVADYVVPPEEADAFFVTTNAIATVNQKQDKCPEDPGMKNIICTVPSDCPAGEAVTNGNGVRTGDCVPSDRNSSIKVCEIYAWCPTEVDKLPNSKEALLVDSKEYTVLIKNWIEFPKFNVKRRNIIDSVNDQEYLQSCQYNSSDSQDKYCPVFKLDTVVTEAGENYTEMAVKGGVIAIGIAWDCNLDFDKSRCVPKYSFRRLDDQTVKIAPGWNFRHAYHYRENGTAMRDLIKVYGIRFVIKVTGRAGKFSIVPLLLNLGSGLALLAIATVLCDLVTMHVLKKGDFYQDKKYFFVTDDDAFQFDKTDVNPLDVVNSIHSEMIDWQASGESVSGASAAAEEEGRVKKRSSNKPGEYSRLKD